MVFSCARNPVTGKKEFMLLSEDRERAMGEQSDPSIVASFGLYEDDRLQKFINEKGMEMAKISHRPNLPYEFKILDSPVVNAFAVPGGYVYFTRGILAHFNNEAEFAGVLGHEIGHITARHSAKQYSKQMLAQVGFIAGVVVSPQFRQFADVAQQGIGLMFLKFGRDNESESDRLGVEYSTKVGYDAKEMAGFFSTLKQMREQSGAEPIPDFLSTHPNPANREQNVRKLATEWQSKVSEQNFEVNRDSYLDMIDGIVYGEDPRQGYVSNDYFYHPELKFQFPVPRGWNTSNTPQQFQMAPTDGKALMFLRLAQGQSLDSAAQAMVQQNNINVVNSRQTRVNGLDAIEILGDIPAQDAQSPAIRIATYLIQYNSLIYQIAGLSTAADFANYQRIFDQTMLNFRELTDPSRINVMPNRLQVVEVRTNSTLAQELDKYNVSSAMRDEHALINGLSLADPISTGKKIKIIQENWIKD